MASAHDLIWFWFTCIHSGFGINFPAIPIYYIIYIYILILLVLHCFLVPSQGIEDISQQIYNSRRKHVEKNNFKFQGEVSSE